MRKKNQNLRTIVAMLFVFLFVVCSMFSSGMNIVTAEETETMGEAIYVTESNYEELGLTKEYVGYYAIGNAEQLYWFAEKVNSGGENTKLNAVLLNDIVVNENLLTEKISINADGTATINDGADVIKWEAIANTLDYAIGCYYYGEFDGRGYVVSGLYSDAYYASGLFGIINVGGVVKNVGVVDSYFNGGETGAIASANIGGIVEKCYSDSVVCSDGSRSNSYAGGVCGSNSGYVIECYNKGEVYATAPDSGAPLSGGIVGYLQGGYIKDCYNVGTISAFKVLEENYAYAGGIVGEIFEGRIINCFNIGLISSDDMAGGICGLQWENNLTNCFYLDTLAVGDEYAISMTEEQFASGAVTYLLNNECSEGELVWYQSLGIDDFPVLDSEHGIVYGSYIVAAGGDKVVVADYTNNKDAEAIVLDYDFDANGYIEYNNQIYCQPAVCVTNDNYVDLELDADYIGYYAVKNAGQLEWFAMQANDFDSDINVVLVDDIIFNENVLIDNVFNEAMLEQFRVWIPVKNYTGIFDGQNHVIRGLYFNDSEFNYVGLFGNISDGAFVKNVSLAGSYLKGNQLVAGICAKVDHSTVSDCNVSSIIEGYYTVGGICGSLIRGTINNCYNTNNIAATGRAGGICGTMNYSVIKNSFNTGNVTGGAVTGGICGETNSGNNVIVNVYNVGDIIGRGNFFGAISSGYGSGTTTILNAYYLSGSARTEKNGVVYIQNGIGSQDVTIPKEDIDGATIPIDESQIASGEVAYFLSQDCIVDGVSYNGTDWRQVIGTNQYPILSDSADGIVYMGYKHNATTVSYSNNIQEVGHEKSDEEEDHDAYVICTDAKDGTHVIRCSECNWSTNEAHAYTDGVCKCGSTDTNMYVQYKKESDGEYTLRFIYRVPVSNIDKYSSVGISCEQVDKLTGKMVFSSVKAGGVTVDSGENSYFVVVEFTNVIATDEFTITPIAEVKSEDGSSVVEILGSTYSFNMNVVQ